MTKLTLDSMLNPPKRAFVFNTVMPPRNKRRCTDNTSNKANQTQLSPEIARAIREAVASQVNQTPNGDPTAISREQQSQIQFIPDSAATVVQQSIDTALRSFAEVTTPSRSSITSATASTTTAASNTQPSSASTQITDSLTTGPPSSIISSLVGGSQDNQQSSKNPFVSTSVPLGSMVSAKTRNKIWANEYVNFELLLHTQVTDDCYSIKMLHNKQGGHPALTIVPNQKKQTITNIESWTNAFHIFTAIYMEKWPQDGPALMKYGAVVRDLAQNFASWKFYDEHFRVLREKQTIPWDNIHSEFWLRANQRRTSSSENRNTFRPAATQSSPGHPRGYCFRYHGGKHCAGCTFKHQCYKCYSNHPIFRCPQSGQSKDRDSPNNIRP